ncbi:MAG: translation initiation factor IF-2 [Buchnera aphidicola (Nurudea yanoniella)]
MKISVKNLIKKCISAGIVKTTYNCISCHEKKILDEYLKTSKFFPEKTLTVRRKTRSTLSVSGMGGKNKYVQVEIRKKKVYKKFDKELNNKKLKNTNTSIKKHSLNIHSNKDTKNGNIVHSFKNIIENNCIIGSLKKKLAINQDDKKIKNFSKITENKNDFLKKIELNKNLNTKNYNIDERKVSKGKVGNRVKSIKNNKNYISTSIMRTNYINIRSNNNLEISPQFRNKKNKKSSRYKNNRNIIEKKITLENLKKFTYINQKNQYYKNSVLNQIFTKPSSLINRNIIIGNIITVSELANKMAVKSSKLVETMKRLGYIVTVNQTLDRDIAQLVAEEMGHKVTICHENELEQKIMENRNINTKIKEPRPPIVTIMGHVDHGKTSLLDYIRLTKVASQEAGGITQHIGAYYITINDKVITFLDTPGHAAFTAMRSRGAQITDIVVLVVAADDGVKPQTIEAIQHAQAASVPILVAINKIDKLESEPEKIKNELMKYNIVPEEWGGENIFVYVSAKSGEGIDNLLKSIIIQSEILELKTVYKGMATGSVIEAFLERGNGPSATVLIQEGTLNKGDIVLCGLEYGKIRAIKNLINQDIQSASPSIPVKILGLSGIPISGDKIIVVKNEKAAREVALYRQKKFREKNIFKRKAVKLSNIFENIKQNNILELNIILKSDVQGSLEAISDSLNILSNNDVKIKIIGKGIGNITETDTSLALASNAIIIGFNVKSESSAKRIINAENVDCRCYSVIYHIIDEIKKIAYGMKSPKYKTKVLGLAEVRSIFKSQKFGNIAGCMVIDGVIKRNNLVRILRKNKEIYEGELESLKRFKEDANEVRNGVECGIGIKNYHDIRINDVIEAFCTLEIK